MIRNQSLAVAPAVAAGRLEAVDWLRGLVMVLMVLDHAREYSSGPGRVADPMDLASTPPLLFWMRWLSHFCAPVFAFLMGVSAYGSFSRRGPDAAARHFLIRGLVLIALEFTVIDWSWTFNPLWPRKFFQVIAALGVAQLALGAMVRWGARPMIILGGLILATHNLADGVRFDAGSAAHYLWSFLHQKNVLPLGGGFEVRTTYPVLPIVGVALCGFGLSGWLFGSGEQLRQQLLRSLGWAGIGAFLALRLTAGYGDANPFAFSGWNRNSLFSLLNVTKYPLSLHFVLMTLGPALLLLGARQQLTWLAEPLRRLGRVPLFFYIAHLYALHLLAWSAAAAVGFRDFSVRTRFGGIPEGFGFPLEWTPAVALLVTAGLLPACRWYERLRAGARYPILRLL